MRTLRQKLSRAKKYDTHFVFSDCPPPLNQLVAISQQRAHAYPSIVIIHRAELAQEHDQHISTWFTELYNRQLGEKRFNHYLTQGLITVAQGRNRLIDKAARSAALAEARRREIIRLQSEIKHLRQA